MPTYTHRCSVCGRTDDHLIPLGEYLRNPPAFVCCAQIMERAITVAPGLAVHNALASERHYEGLRAPDGADISSRAKHRAYMQANNLTTADDFTQTWKRAAEERAQRLEGHDPARVRDVAEAVTKLGG